ncbi:hypothetical protein EG68_09144 [Paragonimus skrjabini miyazakii]|uniref:Granulins domain-containing protein n=1 Tax=Paragonimus skrjabini miyazakii TaxID=59628 RepID=A0A8S9YCJ9_9TREM|nr:hypothetical protein EG68_09144 [Paragonimus skrjabini miyazakii]
MWGLTLEVILITTLVFFTSALYEPSVCQDCCSNGSCCEVQLNQAACCPFVNGVCCAGGKTCCPQGSVCDAAKIACNYPNAQTTIPMKELVIQQGPNAKRDPGASSDTQCLLLSSALVLYAKMSAFSLLARFGPSSSLELQELQAEDCPTVTIRHDACSNLPGSNIRLS